MNSRCATALRALVLGLGALSLPASAAELIVNGGFEADGVETYAPAGWSVFETGQMGGVLATGAAASPASGWATVGPASGAFYGLVDAFTISHNALVQDFSTGAVTAAMLSFRLFVNDQGDGVPHGHHLGLDSTVADPNKHSRVDLLAAGTETYATGAGVLRTFYLDGPTGPGAGDHPNGYLSYSFDVTDLLAGGGSFRLRFANVSNLAALQMGVDDVSVNVTPVPEPETYALMLAGLGLLGARARRRAAR